MFDQNSWERRWSRALREHGHLVAQRPPNAHRLAGAVAPGGTLLLVAHRPVDPTTGAPTAAAGQVQVDVDTATAALDPSRWEVLVAEDRPRRAAGTGVDAVVRATSRVT